MAFHPSGTVIASCASDQAIKLYDLRTHTLIQHYANAHSHPSIKGPSSCGVNSIAFGGHAAEWLISTGLDGLVKVNCFLY